MKSIALYLAALSFFSLNFIDKEINECYLTFRSAADLVPASRDRLPEHSRKPRVVQTDNGEVTVTVVDGYRILYNNKKDVAFVNLKVELSDEKSYGHDKKNLIDNLKYMNSHSTRMESKDLIELQMNGYTIYGLSRATIEVGSILGTFIMFPGDGVVVYFYFNNLEPEDRNFESVDDYKKQRDQFIDAYTKHLRACGTK
jgi:hypothetical protein